MPPGTFCSSRELELSSARLCHAACDELGFQWDGPFLGESGVYPPKCFITYDEFDDSRKCRYNLDPNPNRHTFSSDTIRSLICKNEDVTSK